MSNTTAGSAATATMPAPRPGPEEPPAPAAHPPRPHLVDWLQPRPVVTNGAAEQVYALPTARHGDRVVTAVCQPGKPDGEVVTGPHRLRDASVGGQRVHVPHSALDMEPRV